MVGGAAVAALFSGSLDTILYGVSRHDFATLAGVAVLMCLVTGVATYVPARRTAPFVSRVTQLLHWACPECRADYKGDDSYHVW